MEFFTFSNQPRPIRLCEATRTFAYQSVYEHKYGKDTIRTPAAVLPETENFDNLPDIDKYDRAIAAIVEQAPVRICEGELLSGAATFGSAIDHFVPATHRGNLVCQSISHLTVDYKKVLTLGMDGILQEVETQLCKTGWCADEERFLKSAKHCILQMKKWHARYLSALKGDSRYATNYQNLLQVPFQPARNFHEAAQSIWFCFAFMRLCGNWPGIGRIDYLLGEYLKRDLASGALTYEQAREILAHFWIKGCEWITGTGVISGDAQHYQNVLLGGVDENGKEVTNKVTYLVLDILEELGISDYPTSVRLNSHSPEKLITRVAEVMKHGGGTLAVYNEEKIIQSLTKHGYELKEARSFANDGCWEIQVPGRTYFSYLSFDGLSLLLNDVLHLKETPAHFDSFNDLKEAYYAVLDKFLDDLLWKSIAERGGQVCDEGIIWTPPLPTTVVSIFEPDCIERAKPYYGGGPKYIMMSPHIGGAADVGNALRAIDKICFIEKLLPFDEFMQVLQNNWEGYEPLRQYALNKISYYGNDDDEADAYTVELLNRYSQSILKNEKTTSVLYVPGVSTFGRQIEWRLNRTAVPHGHKAGEILAPNMGATPGSDVAGATALIRSYCKIDLVDQVSGAALDVKLLPSTTKGENGTAALAALLRGFVALGGCFMQPDVIDNSILKEAQEHPENYQSLSIRVSGWNARFVTLNKEWQDMCIEKTTHGEW